MRRALLVIAALLVALPLCADTAVSGTISTNTTWTLANSPYVLTGNVWVEGSGSPVLTIEAGVVVKGNANAQLLINYNNKGALIVNGTSSDPVTFTANGSTAAGYWYGLRFGTTAGGPASSVTYATVEYAGSNYYGIGGITVHQFSPSFDHVTVRVHQHAGIRIEAGSPSITNSTISDNGGYGIFATGGNATLTDDALVSNSGIAVSVPVMTQLSGMTGLSATGNGTNGVEYRGGTMTADRTWPTSAIPYIVTGTIDVMNAAAPVLTIGAGNTIKFNTNSQISCNHSAKGAIQAIGTSSAPILFTSNTTATAGAWLGLWFGPTAAAPQSNLAYVTVEYGGSNFNARGGITINANTPAFDHVTLRNNQFSGVAVNAGGVALTDSTITANGGPGINFVNSNGSLSMTNVTITNNTGYAVTVPCSTALAATAGLTASGNGTGKDAIEVRGGTMTASATWPLSSIPYVVTGTIDVMNAAAPVLTIAAGNTIRFNSGSQISVNHSAKGALQAVGTPTAPIRFTSNTTAANGAWLGLWFGPTAGAPQSNVAYATIEYGGSNYNARGGVTLHANSPSFDHVTFSNNQYANVEITGGSPVITNSTLTASTGPGIHATGGSAITLTDDTFTNNNGYAVTIPVTMAVTGASNLSATGNGTGRDGIEYRGGTMVASTTWPTSAIPYIVTGTVDVMNAAAPVLTIAEGNTIRFNGGAQISCNHSAKGGLQILGTASAPVLLTYNGTGTPGAWLGLWFGPTAAAPQSNINYATIEYGGSNYYARGGVSVHANAPVFDHVTIRNSQFAGVLQTGGSPVFTSSTIRDNGGPGINATGGTALTLTNDAFTNNGGMAVTLHANLSLTDASGLTATGNGTGRDGIEYRGGTLSGNLTWPLASLPYIVSGTIDVMNASAPILTIVAGNTIKFNASSQISCNHSARGALQVLGTASAPVLFTFNGAGTPGSWLGLWFGPTATPPQSNVNYAIVEYAGSNFYARGGIQVNGATSPQFDHVTIRNNQRAGLEVTGSATPRITNTVFTGNPEGVKNSGSGVVQASLNYWNSASGPCLPGSCATGQQSATAGVQVEPWLLSAPSEPHYLATALQKNRSFSPAIGAQMSVDYTTSLAGDVAITVRNASNTVVRTFNNSGTPGAFAWDGKNDSGVVQPDGTYSFEMAATATAQPPAAIAKGLTIIDSSKGLTLTTPTAAPLFFSPNADAVQDTTTVVATANYDDTAWTVSVLDPSSNVVRTQNGTGTAVSYTWDGKDASAATQADGLYTLRVDASIGTATQQKSATATLDNTAPAVSIATPVASDVLSNVYTSGVTTVVPTGSATDTNMSTWTIQVGAGAAPTVWSNIGSGVASFTGNLGTWATAAANNGTWAVKLVSTDKAGNTATTTTSPITLGNFKAVQSAYQFNPASGGTLTYTSTIPFPLTETLTVKNAAGTVVRNLVTSVARAAGSFNDVFTGRDDANAVLPDGPYFYFASVTDGTHTLAWDLSNDFRNDYFAWNDGLGIQAYDPFNNKPMKFNYNFAQAGRVSIATSTNPGSVIGNCLAPTATFYCPAVDRWEESGAHTFTWSGIDHTGGYRSIRSAAIVTNTNNFPKNAAVLYGTKPKVDVVKVTPPVYGPEVGTQTIEFDLTTYQSQAVDISIALVNLSTLSTLRTLTLSGQSPGHVTTTWDGLADNGMRVAPGFYDVVVTATDGLGNVVKGDILTTIQY